MTKHRKFRPVSKAEAERLNRSSLTPTSGPLHPTDEKYIGDLTYHCPHCDAVLYEGMNEAWLRTLGPIFACWSCQKPSVPPTAK